MKAILGLLLCAAASMLAADQPNIVLIFADDLGVNDLGCYGRKEHRTPNLDRLAEQGSRFTRAYTAQPICSPSRAALMTGKHPARLHLTNFLPGRAAIFTSPENYFLAVRAAGWWNNMSAPTSCRSTPGPVINIFRACPPLR